LFYDDNGTLTGNEEFTIEMKIIQPLGEELLFPMLYEALRIQPISTARSMPDINEPENIPKEETGNRKKQNTQRNFPSCQACFLFS
jgi:hypothetical protein